MEPPLPALTFDLFAWAAERAAVNVKWCRRCKRWTQCKHVVPFIDLPALFNLAFLFLRPISIRQCPRGCGRGHRQTLLHVRMRRDVNREYCANTVVQNTFNSKKTKLKAYNKCSARGITVSTSEIATRERKEMIKILVQAQVHHHCHC